LLSVFSYFLGRALAREVAARAGGSAASGGACGRAADGVQPAPLTPADGRCRARKARPRVTAAGDREAAGAREREKERGSSGGGGTAYDGVWLGAARRSFARGSARSGGNDVVDEEKTTAAVRARSGAVGKEKKELCPL